MTSSDLTIQDLIASTASRPMENDAWQVPLSPQASAGSGGEDIIAQSVEDLCQPASTSERLVAERPWPIRQTATTGFSEERYRLACEKAGDADSLTLFPVRRLLRLEVDAFVASAFKLTTGQCPNRSEWHADAERLAAGSLSKEDILSRLVKEGQHTGAGSFALEAHCLQPFFERVELGLQDVLRLLPTLLWRQCRRRTRLLLDALGL